MGEKLLTTTVASLVIIGAIDWFDSWYGRFLHRRGIDPGLRKRFRMVQWLLLAILFWFSLMSMGMPSKFGTSFFLFVLFIYSVRGLIAAATSKNSGRTQR